MTTSSPPSPPNRHQITTPPPPLSLLPPQPPSPPPRHHLHAVTRSTDPQTTSLPPHGCCKITSTIKYKDVPNSAIKLMLFPFSLTGAARRWLEKEPPRSILTWEDLVSKFINEFFPLSRMTNLRNEISNFQQRFDESFHEVWDRYTDLLCACPHHGFTALHQLDTFYNALNPANQDSLNSAACGNLLERCSGPLPSNTIANPKGELKVIITRSGIVLNGPFVPIPPPFIKVPPPLVQKSKPHSQRNFMMHQRDPLYPNILYPSRMHK
uniref:Reverse transcriptase domain-containing protein n=1 Tax=Tanacetum cinerariifolium TaxID=118510 RepID=A0A699I000_TANCI|nr:reverse transcriptase domain-containing protein [Tanacetum cinerariifolium]